MRKRWIDKLAETLDELGYDVRPNAHGIDVTKLGLLSIEDGKRIGAEAKRYGATSFRYAKIVIGKRSRQQGLGRRCGKW